MENKLYKVVNGNRTLLMLPNNNDKGSNFDIVYGIPSSEVSYVWEFSILNLRFPILNGRKVFFSYYDNDWKQYVLESFDLDLNSRCISNINKRYVTGDEAVCLGLGTFYFVDENNLKTLLSIYGNELRPQKSVISNNSIEFADFTCGDYAYDDCFELILNIENEERLHVLMMPPTERRQYFRIYRHGYSEITDKYFEIYPGFETEDDYFSYECFINWFRSSDISKEIFSKISEKRNRIGKMVRELKKVKEIK